MSTIHSGLKTIEQIKSIINQERSSTITSLGMNRQFTVLNAGTESETKEPQPWVSHWEDPQRIRVVMHEDVCTKLKADKTRCDLLLKYELVPAKGDVASYHRYVVIIPDNVVATF